MAGRATTRRHRISWLRARAWLAAALLGLERLPHQLAHREMRRVGADIDRRRFGHGIRDALLRLHHHDVFVEDAARIAREALGERNIIDAPIADLGIEEERTAR